jgi:acylphosphatase
MQKRYEGIVSGKVQGVMFRDFVRRNASQKGIVGRVWNNTDGTVGFIMEGKGHDLDMLLEAMRKGPLWAKVEDVSYAEGEGSERYDDFRIILRKDRPLKNGKSAV